MIVAFSAFLVIQLIKVYNNWRQNNGIIERSHSAAYIVFTTALDICVHPKNIENVLSTKKYIFSDDIWKKNPLDSDIQYISAQNNFSNYSLCQAYTPKFKKIDGDKFVEVLNLFISNWLRKKYPDQWSMKQGHSSKSFVVMFENSDVIKLVFVPILPNGDSYGGLLVERHNSDYK